MKRNSFEPKTQSVHPTEDVVLRHPFLANLDSRFQHIYCDSAKLRKFAAGEDIFEGGGEADHFYLLIHGTVAIETFVPNSGMVTLQSVGPGEAIGWSWLFAPYKWTFTARAETPVELVCFDARTLRGTADVEFQNDLLRRVSGILINRLHSMRMQLIDPSGLRAATAKNVCKNGDEAFFG